MNASGARRADSTSNAAATDAAPSSVQPVPIATSVTVAICTRERGAAVLLPLKAILEGTFADVHVLVVDQSDGFETARALLPFDGCERLTYLRTDSRGLSAARNEALRANRSPWLAFTDDDCEPAPDWLEQMMRTAQEVTGPAMLFGSFLPNLALSDQGMVPGWKSRTPGRKSDTWREYCLGGFGGNMALNAEAIALAGRFNPDLGRGGTHSACEEGEFALRLCLLGGSVHELSGPVVLHHGLIKWDRVRDALRDDYGATGFVLAWYLRRGRWSALSQLIFCSHNETRQVLRNIWHGRRPIGFRRPYWLWRGAFQGIRSTQEIPFLSGDSKP